MYGTQKENLRKNHVSMVDQLDPNDVIDQLQQDGVLTESDHELINTGKTRKERCRMLLGILPTRGPVAYVSFKKALSQNYSYLEQLLSEATSGKSKTKDACADSSYNNESIRGSDDMHSSGICSKCQPYMPAYIVNPGLKSAVQQHCCLILENVEANDLLDVLYQEAILEGNDCEWIKSMKTRQDRCIAMLRNLSQCVNSDILTIFIESLRRKYSFIADRLDIVNKEVSEEYVHSRSATINDERRSYPILHAVMHGNLEVKTMKVLTSNKKHFIPETNVIREEGYNNSDELNWMEKVHLCRTCSIQTRFWQSTCSHAKCRIPSTYSQFHQPAMCLNSFKENHANDTRSLNQDTRIKRKRHGNPLSSHTTSKYLHLNTSHCQVLTQPYRLRSNSRETAFNYLSTLINQGSYKEFEACAVDLRKRQSSDVDMMCIIDYLFASRFLNAADVDSAKAYIKSGLRLASKTCYPKYFTLELFTCQTRMLLIKKKLGKLQNILDDAKMIIEADPTCCTGRAAGWLYMNDVKKLMIQISMLNKHRSNYQSVYEHLHKQAKDSCQKSIDHFKRDNGKDGPFGFGFALCRLIILLLRCGDRGLYKDGMTPDPENVELAGKYLYQLEDSDIPITTFLKVPVLLAKSDYHYRRQHTQRALEYAEEAFQLAENNSILEFKEQAQNRVYFLCAKMDMEGK